MSQRNRLSVLVVEDRLEEAFPLAALLSADGNDVRIAADGQAALSKVLTQLPDVLVLDLGLPKLDGLEVAAAVRRVGLPWRPWIVAVSGHDEQWVLDKAIAAGIDAYFVKPVALGELRALLGSLSPVRDTATKEHGKGESREGGTGSRRRPGRSGFRLYQPAVHAN